MKKVILALICAIVAASCAGHAAAAQPEGLSVLIVLDSSSSMLNSNPDTAVIEQLKNMIAGLDENSSATIAFFDEVYTETGPFLPLGATGNVEELCNRLDNARFEGAYTNMGLALAEAHKTLAGRKKPVLVFISDGIVKAPANEDLTEKGAANASGRAFQELAGALTYPFYPVYAEYREIRAEAPGSTFAETDIPYYHVKSGEDAAQVFAQIAENISFSYHALQAYCVDSMNAVVDSGKANESFGYFVHFLDNNGNPLSVPYAKECSAVLKLDGESHEMLITEEGTAFFKALSFPDGGEYSAEVTVTHPSGRVYTGGSVIKVIPPAVQSTPDSPPKLPEEKPPIRGVLIFGFALCILLTAAQWLRKRRSQKVVTEQYQMEYYLVDEFGNQGLCRSMEFQGAIPFCLSEMLTDASNTGYLFHDINNITVKQLKNGKIMVQNGSNYYILRDGNEQPQSFELKALDWIEIRPRGDINAASIWISWKAKGKGDENNQD